MKRVLCIVDSYRWALHNRAVALEKAYPRCRFDIKHFVDLKNVRFDNYDVVYSLNWPMHGYIENKISRRGLRSYRLITGLSSHIGHPSDRKFFNLLSNYDAIGTSNKFLYSNFRKKFSKLNIVYTPFGVDCTLFKPRTDPRKFSNVFGWVGNSGRPVKRFKEIEECINSLGGNIKLITATHKSKYSRAQMAEFYNKIGTIICFSESEGTPNPVLEAAACGRNIISTNVGNVPELLHGLQSGMIVRSSSELKEAIYNSSINPELIAKSGLELSARIKKEWCGSKRASLFEPLLGIKRG